MSDTLFGIDWKMNKGLSAFSGGWSPEQETRLYEKLDNGYKLTVSGEHQGQPYEWHYTAFYDGKTHAVSGRSDANGIVIYKLNDKETAGFFSLNSLPVGAYKRTVNDDGTSLQVEAAGKRTDGSAYYDVVTYKKGS